MNTLAALTGQLRAEWREIHDLCAGLSPDQWSVQSYCPDWNMAGVLTHVVGVEHVLTGWVPSTEVPPPFAKMAEFEAEADGLGGRDLLGMCSAVMAARLAELDAMDPAVVDLPAFTPTGIGTYGGFLRVRVFDFWVHHRDMAGPLAVPTVDSGGAAQTSLAEVASAIGYIVGKKIGLPDGMGITFHIVGGVVDDLHVKVDGRAARVEQLPDPDVEITVDVGTFILLAAGRVDPQDRIDDGRIAWAGDPEWGEKAARNLRYTM